MWLLLAHPELPSCADCQEYLYDPAHGWLPVLKARGTKDEFHARREAGCATPCPACPKIPHGAEPKPDNAIELTDKNWRAYQHWKECKAVDDFPKGDRIVRRNAALIEDACAGWERMNRDQGALRQVLGLLGGGK